MNFIFEPYKEIYGYYHSHGVELVIHHSDSYAATLVPSMIEMGIDVWQGCMGTNNLPELIKKYGGKISFMGGIENRAVDFESWTDEIVMQLYVVYVRNAVINTLFLVLRRVVLVLFIREFTNPFVILLIS